MEQRVAHVAAEAHRHAGPEVDRGDREEGLDDGDAEHHAPLVPDVARVVLEDTLVDDVRVQVGEIQVQDRLDALEAEEHEERPPVLAQAGAQEPDQHGAGPPEESPGRARMPSSSSATISDGDIG